MATRNHWIQGYYYITNTSTSHAGIARDVYAACKAGVRVVQYRAEGVSTQQMYREAARVCAAARRAVCIINNRIDIALAVGARGVHIGQDDMPLAAARKVLGKKRIIGVSVQTLAQAKKAYAGGADYLGVGPVFTTHTKKNAGPAVGIALVRAIKACVPLPLVAIGGITLENAPRVISAGADSVAAIAAVVAAPDSADAIRAFQRLFPRCARI